MCKKINDGNNVVNEYNELIRSRKALEDTMANLGREKDYRVTKISKKYESKIDNIVRELAAIDLQIDIAEQYIASIKDNTEGEVLKNTKKRG